VGHGLPVQVHPAPHESGTGHHRAGAGVGTCGGPLVISDAFVQARYG
jgi:hypothetical protein